jgi:hypothetical protein
MDSLVNLMKNADDDVANEAVWAVSNSTSKATNEQIAVITTDECKSALCICLPGLKNILSSVKKDTHNPYVALIAKHGGVDTLRGLQLHEDLDVYREVFEILKAFFEDEEISAREIPCVS